MRRPSLWFCFDILGQPHARKRISENAKPASQKTGWDWIMNTPVEKRGSGWVKVKGIAPAESKSLFSFDCWSALQKFAWTCHERSNRLSKWGGIMIGIVFVGGGYTFKLDYGWLFLFLVKSVHRETLWNVNRKAIHGIGSIPIGNI